jgi:hypothetical protein
MEDDKPPTREELLAAREDIERQLVIVENPIRSSPHLPTISRLKALLAEINNCLTAMDAEDAQRP